MMLLFLNCSLNLPKLKEFTLEVEFFPVACCFKYDPNGYVVNLMR